MIMVASFRSTNVTKTTITKQTKKKGHLKVDRLGENEYFGRSDMVIDQDATLRALASGKQRIVLM